MDSFQDYQWVVGFDNSGTLVNIEDDIPTFQGLVAIAKGKGEYRPGLKRRKADRGIAILGLATTRWTMTISFSQWAYIQSTYTAGGIGYSAEMTIRTPGSTGGFENLNATFDLPFHPDSGPIADALASVVLEWVIDGAAA